MRSMTGRYLPIIKRGRENNERGLLITIDAFTRKAVYDFTIDQLLLERIMRMEPEERRKKAEGFIAERMEKSGIEFPHHLKPSLQDLFRYRLQKTNRINFDFCDYALLSLVRKSSPLTNKAFTIDVDRKCTASGKPIKTICPGDRTERCIHIVLSEDQKRVARQSRR